MQRLEESKNMEAEERARLEEEIRMKQEEVSTIYQQVCIPEFIYHFLNILILLPNPKKIWYNLHFQVRTKEDENVALQSEMENARHKHEVWIDTLQYL